MSQEITFSAADDNPNMVAAFKKAQETFKYFWRELSWERRRIVPALDVACVKAAFSQELSFMQKMRGKKKPVIEHMWINEIQFDGNRIKGILMNEPNDLTNVKKGAEVEIPLSQLSDWLFAGGGKTYGGFTIQAMRSEMTDKERAEHDEAWGQNFGDCSDILIVFQQKEHPEHLIEHPMSKNMREQLVDFLKQNPGELTDKDEAGYTFLHKEAIAGNLTSVEVLLQAGADKNQKTNSGKTALDFAQQLGWQHIVAALQ